MVLETHGINGILLDLMQSNPPMSEGKFEEMAKNLHNFSPNTVREFVRQAVQSGDVIEVTDDNDKRKRKLKAVIKVVSATTEDRD